MRRVLLHFDHYNGLWWVGFLEADCKTSIGQPTRYYRFATLDGLRAFFIRCNPENLEKFEHGVRAWRRGSNFVNLTDDQYNKLQQPRKKSVASSPEYGMVCPHQGGIMTETRIEIKPRVPGYIHRQPDNPAHYCQRCALQHEFPNGKPRFSLCCGEPYPVYPLNYPTY